MSQKCTRRPSRNREAIVTEQPDHRQFKYAFMGCACVECRGKRLPPPDPRKFSIPPKRRWHENSRLMRTLTFAWQAAAKLIGRG